MKDNHFYAYFGGYGLQYWVNVRNPDIEGKCDGISVCDFNGDTGEMKKIGYLGGIDSPATLVVSRDQKYLYAADEVKDFGGKCFGGGVTAFRIDADKGSVELINQSLAYGASTAYVNVDKTGRYLLVANHGSKFYCTRYDDNGDGTMTPRVLRDEGCVCLFEVREDGGIGRLLDRVVLEGTGADPSEHASPHPHSVYIDDQDYVIVPNKGGDNIYVLKLNRGTGKLDTLSVYKSEYGSSPRHATFVPGTDYVLVINEFDAHLNSYRLDRNKGTLTHISRIDTYDPNHSAWGVVGRVGKMAGTARPWALDVHIHPNGKFVYCNNAQGIICLFTLDRETGELTFVRNFKLENGNPRGMQIDRAGNFIVGASWMNDLAVCYRIDPQTGWLTLASELSLPTPTALRFVYPNK